MPDPLERRAVLVPPLGLGGELAVLGDPCGLVLSGHGSESGRLRPLKRAVADRLNAQGFAALLFDILTPDEATDRRNVFDIPLLAGRIAEATLYVSAEPDVAGLPLGLFVASSGAGAALVAAAEPGTRIAAVVSRGGRLDLAAGSLRSVGSSTLLIVGGDDVQALALNRNGLAALSGKKELKIVPHAVHLFEGADELEAVADIACDWFTRHLRLPDDAVHPQQEAHFATDTDIVVTALRAAIEPLPPIEDPAFATAFDRYARVKVVLLGEASHGTLELLPRPRHHHASIDRATWLHAGRARGGLAGLVAGAMSIAAGEYVSISSQTVKVRPILAALVLAPTFAVGAVVPQMVVLLAPARSIIGLALLGGLGASAGGAGVAREGLHRRCRRAVRNGRGMTWTCHQVWLPGLEVSNDRS